jgi:HEAT repeat protein
LEINTIKLKYATVERFLIDYNQLQTGSLVLPVKSSLPLNTRILLEFSIPKIVPALILKGIVTKTFDDPGSAGLQNSGIIQIGFNGNLKNAVYNFNKVLLSHKKYCAAQETAELAHHVRNNLRGYIKSILHLKSSEKALVFVKLFRRVLPDLIQQADWSTAFHLTRAVDRAAKTTVFFAVASELPANPLESVFENQVQKIINGYATANAAQREMIHDIARRLDATGLEIMAGILSDYTDGQSCKAATSFMINKGEPAKNWILAVLDAPGQKWHLKRTALMLLGHVANKEEDIDRARKLAGHDDPRIRKEALSVLIKLQAAGVEEIIVAALSDPDDSVRCRAMNCLTRLSPISENVIKLLLIKISAGAPPQKNDAARHYRKIVELIKALESASARANLAEVESIIISFVRKLSYRNKWLFRRLKNSIDAAEAEALSAAIKALGKIGTYKSESFLEELADSNFPQAEPAQAAANHIKLRYVARLSDAPADVNLSALA